MLSKGVANKESLGWSGLLATKWNGKHWSWNERDTEISFETNCLHKSHQEWVPKPQRREMKRKWKQYTINSYLYTCIVIPFSPLTYYITIQKILSSPVKINQTVNPSVHSSIKWEFIIYNHKSITAPPCFRLVGEWTLTGMAARGLPKSCRWATFGTLTTATLWDLVSDDIQKPSSFDSTAMVNNGGGATLTIQSKHLETPWLNEYMKKWMWEVCHSSTDSSWSGFPCVCVLKATVFKY